MGFYPGTDEPGDKEIGIKKRSRVMEAGGSEDERKLVGGWVGVDGWRGGFRLICRETAFTVTSGLFLVSVQTCIFILVPNQPPRIFPNFWQLKHNLSNPHSPPPTPPPLFSLYALISFQRFLASKFFCCGAAGGACTGKLILALKCTFDGASAAHDGWH